MVSISMSLLLTSILFEVRIRLLFRFEFGFRFRFRFRFRFEIESGAIFGFLTLKTGSRRKGDDDEALPGWDGADEGVRFGSD